jgi:hypothetical protein
MQNIYVRISAGFTTAAHCYVLYFADHKHLFPSFSVPLQPSQHRRYDPLRPFNTFELLNRRRHYGGLPQITRWTTAVP